MQDFTGVPAVVDLAAMRDGIVALGGDHLAEGRQQVLRPALLDGISRGDVTRDQKPGGHHGHAAQQAGLVAHALAVGGGGDVAHGAFSARLP